MCASVPDLAFLWHYNSLKYLVGLGFEISVNSMTWYSTPMDLVRHGFETRTQTGNFVL